MFAQLFALAMVSPGRQRALWRAVLIQMMVLAAGAIAVEAFRSGPLPRLGSPGAVLMAQFLLVGGIVQGATLVGWRLTQLPKSQALEFLLVTPQRPGWVFLAEALVGLGRLALVTFACLPVLVLFVVDGSLEWIDLAPMLVMPFTWGAVTGLGLITWAYEPQKVRRWGERVLLGLIVLYLAVGVLVGEHLKTWLAWMPAEFSRAFLNVFEAIHRFSPFSVMDLWMKQGPLPAQDRMLGLEIGALVLIAVCLCRSAWRLQGHFHERHYRPVEDPTGSDRGRIGDWPLTWWAVRRVMEYPGRANIWLAGGFGVIYAAYTVAGPYWPDWLGRKVFEIFGELGGIPVLATSLVVLAAVPAAFQYGLWDSNEQDRCRRLELLLLTELEGRDYWKAALAAAWRRGRGYFAVAVLLWGAAAAAGQLTLWQVSAALSAGVVLWGLYFALGFRAFSRGLQANGLGSLLTLGLPFLVFGLIQAGWPPLAALVPPGSVYCAAAEVPGQTWFVGPLFAGTAALCAGRYALARCDAELRHWYDLHHGTRAAE